MQAFENKFLARYSGGLCGDPQSDIINFVRKFSLVTQLVQVLT